jgi:hypothetical protein
VQIRSLVLAPSGLEPYDGPIRYRWLRGLATATICFSMLWLCHVTPRAFKPLGEAEHQSGELGVGSSNLPAPTN